MKVVRLGMTEGGLLLLNFVARYCNPTVEEIKAISNGIMGLANWLYTTAGYYDKTVQGTNFNFNNSALNKNFFNLI